MSNSAFRLLWVVLLICNSPAAAQELKEIRIGYPSLGFRQGHIWVAKDEGLFKKYGLDVEPVFLRGGQLAIQALAGGDPPIMSIGQVVQASLSGFDLVLIAGVESYPAGTVEGKKARNQRIWCGHTFCGSNPCQTSQSRSQ